jgi:hypothetical protein
MADVNFIDFSTQPFFIERTSEYIKHYNVRGVQLLPNNTLPYIQTTNVTDGIYLEDWEVFIVNPCLSDSISPAKENRLLYSEQFDNPFWVKNFATVDEDAIPVHLTSYSGDKIIESTSIDTETHYIEGTYNKPTTAITYTASVYIKEAELSKVQLRILGDLSSGNANVRVNFDASTEILDSGGASTGHTYIDSGYSNEGNGWYRVWLTATSTEEASLRVQILLFNGGSNSYIGDGVSGIYARGFQLVEGSAVLDYYPTTDTVLDVPAKIGNETDITDYFIIEDVFTDDNGNNQFTWSLTNVPIDFGYNLVHLKVSQLIGETFYSNWFMFTDYQSEKTCRVDYKSYNSDVMQSIQLPIAFKQEFNPVEIGTYYETSTKNTVINTVKYQTYESWLTKIISNDLLLRIIRVFSYKYTYVDLLRCNLFEAIEQKEYAADENFNGNTIKLTFNKSDIYDPLYVEPTTYTQALITLNSVVANSLNAIYTFSFENFVPTYFSFQYSDDQVNWVSENKGVTSAQSVVFSEVGTWYFRIAHPNAISNIIQLDLGSTVIANEDNLQGLKGQPIDLDVLFNDTLVGATTIIAVSTPTNGTATIIESGTKIRYTHNDSATSFDSFTYTISNGITSDTATISMTIVNEESSTMFMRSEDEMTIGIACTAILDVVAYHNGTGHLPRVNDYVFTNMSMTLPFNGLNRYYGTSEGKYLRIDTEGKVTEVGYC